jgi:CheY-like chemotaxis protein
LTGGDPIFGGLHCLVLDDEFLIAFDIQEMLENAGAANVACAGTLKEAMEALTGPSKYDIAILDLKLGGAMAEGLQVAAELAARKIPFVFLTGMRAEELPADAYPGVPVVEKPFQAQDLLDALRKVLIR